jgi:hypothetical protein
MDRGQRDEQSAHWYSEARERKGRLEQGLTSLSVKGRRGKHRSAGVSEKVGRVESALAIDHATSNRISPPGLITACPPITTTIWQERHRVSLEETQAGQVNWSHRLTNTVNSPGLLTPSTPAPAPLTNDLLLSAALELVAVPPVPGVTVVCLARLGRRTRPPGFEGESEANLPFCVSRGEGEVLGVMVVAEEEVVEVDAFRLAPDMMGGYLKWEA